jgi:uncharacterized protein YcfL
MKKLKVLMVLLVAFMVVSCQTAQVMPKTPNQKIAYIDATIQGLGQSTIDAYNAGKLTQADVAYVYQALSTVAQMTDNAQKAYQSNGTNETIANSDANLILTEAITLLQKVQVFLNTKEGK